MAGGGKREGAGRPKGAVNKVTADIKAVAGEYSERAIKVLVEVMDDVAGPAAARVAAAKEIIDRAHGKATATVDVNATVTERKTLADFYGEHGETDDGEGAQS